MKTTTRKPVAMPQIQLGIIAPGDTVYSYASIFPRGTTVKTLGATLSLGKVNGLPDGTIKDCDRAAEHNLDSRLALEFAEELVRRYNAHERILAALDMATATVELGTGKGAQSQPEGWPKTEAGVDVEAVAKMCREVYRRRGMEKA